MFGFGPVVPDGFGIGYIIRDNGLQFSISSKHRQTKRYAHTLKQTLIDMGKLLHPITSVTVSCDLVETNDTPTTSNQSVEYLEYYDDLFGESKDTTTALAPIKSTSSMSTSSGSMDLARVLRRQSSLAGCQLSSFGESIPTQRDV